MPSQNNKTQAENIYVPDYGDLSSLNTCRLILDTVGKSDLQEIANSYLGLLKTSGAIYEINGDYALGIFSSGWCKYLDSASRNLCKTEDNVTALKSGKWLCHESCWSETSLKAIETREPVDLECKGGIRLYAVPILANGKAVGSMSFGFGNPPTDPQEIKQISRLYNVDFAELSKLSASYASRSDKTIDTAKSQLRISAKLIGQIIERKIIKTEAVLTKHCIDNSANAVFWVDKDANFIYVNNSACQHLGYSAEKLLSLKVYDIDPLFPKDNWPSAWQEFKNKCPIRFESTHIPANNKEIPVEITVNYINHSGHEILHAYVRDISAHKQAEKKLRESKEFAEKLIDSMRDGFSLLDNQGVHVNVNNALCQMTGFSKEELIGTGIPHLYWPEEEYEKILASLEESKSGVSKDFELIFKRKNEERFPVLVAPSSMENSEGGDVRLFATFKDISERKLMEDQLRQKTHDLEEIQAGLLKQTHEACMAAEVLHNIGNVITPATISANTLAKTLRSSSLGEDLAYALKEFQNLFEMSPTVPQEEKNHLSQIAEKLPELVRAELNNYLDEIEKINAKHEFIANIITLQNKYTRFSDNLASVDLNQVLDDALQMVDESLRVHGVRVVKQYAGLETTRIEKSKLIQILINLIKNGQEATYDNQKEDRLLTVTTQMEKGATNYVTCSIKDNGHGFSPEQHAYLFSVGYTTKKSGFGLGLHSCQNYLKESGGTIEAKSDGPNLGAEFIVRLPTI